MSQVALQRCSDSVCLPGGELQADENREEVVARQVEDVRSHVSQTLASRTQRAGMTPAKVTQYGRRVMRPARHHKLHFPEARLDRMGNVVMKCHGIAVRTGSDRTIYLENAFS